MTTPSLYQIQQEILNYLQNKPVDAQVLNTETQNELSVYQSLVLNSIEELMESIYPFCYKILEDNWTDLIASYAALYPSKSPIYNHLAKDFSKFLASEEFNNKYTYPNYLSELAAYEWADLEIYNASSSEKLPRTRPLNPIHKIIEFKFPITQILLYLKNTKEDIESIRQTDIEESPEIILIYQDSKTCNTRFFKLSKAVRMILSELNQGEDLSAIQEKYIKIFGQNLKLADLEKLIGDLKKINILIE